MLGLVGFGLSSTPRGLVPNMETLILFRTVQVRRGLAVPGSLALLTSHVPGAEPGAPSAGAAASGATSTLRPFVGGVLVQTISWRVVSLINVPPIAPALWSACDT